MTWLLSFILGLARKYWKPLAIAGAILLAFTFGYFRGKMTAKYQAEKAARVETEKRYGEADKERAKNEKRKDSYDRDRKVNPVNDARDSCILSNDPYAQDCLQ